MSTVQPTLRRSVAAFLACILMSAALLVPAQGKAAQAEDASAISKAELQRKLAEAQERLDLAAREVADLSISLSDEWLPSISIAARPTLGVNIGNRRADDRGEGVEVISVSPGGVAAEAGIEPGDVLIELNGKALKRDDDGTPRNKLLSTMREIEPDEWITLKYLRDGKAATVMVAPRPAENGLFQIPEVARGWRPAVPAMPVSPAVFGRAPQVAFMRGVGVFGNAELVPLTPKLGQYFGAEKGLLVVRAPNDARLKLEEGDVILDIGGRVPRSPTHALHILGSYQAGEELKLNVLRMKKRSSIDITIPED